MMKSSHARYLCKAGVDLATAEKVLAALKSAEVVDANDIVDLEVGTETPKRSKDGNWCELMGTVESSILCTFCLSVCPSQSSLFLVASHSYPKLDSVCPKVWRPFLASKRFSGTAVTVTIIGTWSNCHNRINRGIFLDKQRGQRFQCHCSIGLDSGTLCGNIWFNIRFANLQTKWFEPVFSCFFSNSAIWMHLIVFIIVLLFVFMHTHTTHTHIYIYVCVFVNVLKRPRFYACTYLYQHLFLKFTSSHTWWNPSSEPLVWFRVRNKFRLQPSNFYWAFQELSLFDSKSRGIRTSSCRRNILNPIINQVV